MNDFPTERECPGCGNTMLATSPDEYCARCLSEVSEA